MMISAMHGGTSLLQTGIAHVRKGGGKRKRGYRAEVGAGAGQTAKVERVHDRGGCGCLVR